MESRKEGGEMESKVLEDGTAVIPAAFLRSLGVEPGARVHIRIAIQPLSKRLVRLGVTEEEIEAVSLLQLEPREHVERFLATEGAFVGKSKRRKRR